MARVIALIIALALLGIGAYAAFAGASDAPEFDPTLPWREQVSFWEGRIGNVGGSEAYEEFAAAAASLSYDDRHAKAHAFGAALFTEVGKSGVAVCDARFSFGCFHQFLGDAIASLGLESIPTLNAECFEALTVSPLSCQHGIGHGALAAIGYDDAALREALSICHSLPGADPIGGCYGGVFMEYNMRTMLAEDATTREYHDNPFEPCDSLEGEFVSACLYWQPQWWMQGSLFGQPLEATYQKMGAYCRDFAKTPELSRACFEGIGNVVAQSSNFDPLVAAALCDAAGSTDKERVLCRALGANHFGIDASAEAAAQVCEGLSEDHAAYCLAYATNKANIANVLPL